MKKSKKGSEPKQQIEKVQNGLYLVEREGVKLLATNNGTAIKETTHDEVEGLKTMYSSYPIRLYYCHGKGMGYGR